MTISALDNPSPELVASLKRQQAEYRKIMREVKGTEYYRMGFGAGLDGFEPSERDLAGYEESYPGYAKGWKDGCKYAYQPTDEKTS